MSSSGQPSYQSDSSECDDDDEQHQSNQFEASHEEDDANSSRNQNETSSNDAEQSFVGKICNNVAGVLSKLIRNAKEKWSSPGWQRSDEHDRSTVPPTKRRRLHEIVDDSVSPPDRSHVRLARPSRTDQSSQTNQPFELTERIYSRDDRTPVNVPSVFERASAARGGRDESSVFLPPSATHHSIQPDEREEQHDEAAAVGLKEETQQKRRESSGISEQQAKAREDIFEPFDPFKYLAKIDNASVDPKRRVTTFLGNRCYRKRQEQLRRGIVGRHFFASHQKPTKNLYTSYRTRHQESGTLNDEPISPERGGSPFYNGLTRYGGASAANTLGIEYIGSRNRSSHYSSALIRDIPSARGKKRKLDGKPPVMSASSKRILEILDEFDKAKKEGKVMPTHEEVRQELHEMIHRTDLPPGSLRIPQMLPILRQQVLGVILCEKTKDVPYPPIAPLMTWPLQVYQNTENNQQRETAASAENRTATTEERPNLETVEEREVVLEETVRPEIVQQHTMAPPPPSPLPETEAVRADASFASSVVQEPEQTPEKTADADCSTTGGNAFDFVEPVLLADSEQGAVVDDASVPAFMFDKPHVIDQLDIPMYCSFQQLIAESTNTWVCDVCMVRNDPLRYSCVACENVNKSKASEPKANANKNNETVSVSPFCNLSNVEDAFKALVDRQKATTWVCDACMAPNSVDLDRCLCCEKAKPSASTASSNSANVTPAAMPTVSIATSASDTGTAQTPQPFAIGSYAAPSGGGLQTQRNSIFLHQQPNVPLMTSDSSSPTTGSSAAGSSSTGGIFGARTTVTGTNLMASFGGGSIVASRFGTAPTQANVNNINTSFGNVSRENNDATANPFRAFGQPPANFGTTVCSTA
uniref:RanBP2-type domain-containing protein n=1 Tax=Anopheles minimus TaxID=112268 RepID=A0A182VVJ6_9DIPT